MGFTLPSRTPAVLILYDVDGRVVMTREVSSMGTGRHAVDWSSAERLASGIYMLQLTQGGRSVTTKVAVLR